MKEVFTDIFQGNIWGSTESVSGIGSELKNTINLRKNLEYLFNILNIKSVLDAACGDMNWMQHVNLSGIKYIGYDVVEQLIEDNKEKFKKNKNMSFFAKDVTVDEIRKVDLIIARDLIIHFPIEIVYKAIDNFIKSGSKYLLVTYDSTISYNQDIEIGSYASRNLTKPPFNFPEAIFNILDKEGERKDNDCIYMSLYKLQNLKPFIKKHKKQLKWNIQNNT